MTPPPPSVCNIVLMVKHLKSAVHTKKCCPLLRFFYTQNQCKGLFLFSVLQHVEMEHGAGVYTVQESVHKLTVL